MILDDLNELGWYRGVLPGIAAVERFLKASPLAGLTLGKHEIDGVRLWAGVSDETGRGRDGAVLEAHRRYADIQIALTPGEWIGWSPLAHCRDVKQEYDPARDLVFFRGAPETWFELPPGRFALFLPGDVHAPLAGTGPVRKVVFKLAVD